MTSEGSGGEPTSPSDPQAGPAEAATGDRSPSGDLPRSDEPTRAHDLPRGATDPEPAPQDAPPGSAHPAHPVPTYQAPPPYGAPDHGSPAYGAPPPYGVPEYGGAPPYGAPQHGAPQYGAPQYGAPQYGAPPPYGAPYEHTPYDPSGTAASHPGFATPPPPYGAPPVGYGAPGYPPPPQYGAAPYGPPQFGPPPNNNNLAVASLVSAGVGLPLSLFCIIGVIGSIAGIVLGIMALGQIKKSGERGRGLAIGGICVGAGTLVLYVIVVIFFVGVLSLHSLNATP